MSANTKDVLVLCVILILIHQTLSVAYIAMERETALMDNVSVMRVTWVTTAVSDLACQLVAVMETAARYTPSLNATAMKKNTMEASNVKLNSVSTTAGTLEHASMVFVNVTKTTMVKTAQSTSIT